MATKSFLNAEETAALLSRITSDQLQFLDGTRPCELAFEISHAMGDVLLRKLSRHPEWQSARPIRLGSWSRGEICSKSDVDLLFLGPEATVATLIRKLNEEGIKIRGRVPEDLTDWSVGVEPFDVMAVLSAQAFFDSEKAEITKQVDLIRGRGPKYLRELFRALSEERREREERFDSLANFLEPNLKYGHGALRDLEQANMIRDLFPDKFVSHGEVFENLHRFKGCLLLLRHFSHLMGAGDILSSSLQFELSKRMGEASPIRLMGQVERVLSEVSFWADWVEELAQKPTRKNPISNGQHVSKAAKGRESGDEPKVSKGKEQLKLTLAEALAALKKDPSILNQARLRQTKIDWPDKKQVAKIFSKYFHADMSEKKLLAIFRSQLLEKVVPELLDVKGLVQHDQYHRFSCDAHTLQALREVLRLKKKPGRFPALKGLVRELSEDDWSVLLWTALFHDLGKGKAGDHATVGEKIVIRHMTSTGHRLRPTIEVAWMVRNHLLISQAAFRMNPRSPATWSELFKRGVRGGRIVRLAIFTAIDIRATNPDALNDWKEKLLSELVGQMRSKSAGGVERLVEQAQKSKVSLDRSLIEGIDLQLLDALPMKRLVGDLGLYVAAKNDLPPVILKGRGDDLWVRFHSYKDRPGLFVGFCSRLLAAGLSVSEAFVFTHAEFGAYDWFKVKTKKLPRHILPVLIKFNENTKSSDQDCLKNVRFSVVDVVSRGSDEAILSIRGKDQRGALLAAGQALYKSGFEIRAAKVHTWGRQIDDVFTVKTPENFESAMGDLRSTLVEAGSVRSRET